MSTIEDDALRARLPANLPDCDCFDRGDPTAAMRRCGDAAELAHAITAAFMAETERRGMCARSLSFAMDTLVLSLATSVATAEAPAVEYGSQEAEWETQRLLAGIEQRVTVLMRWVYAQTRRAGITPEMMREFVESRRKK